MTELKERRLIAMPAPSSVLQAGPDGVARVEIGDEGDDPVAIDLPVGGPYSFDVELGGRKHHVEDLLVGDVWLLGGQSNMQGAEPAALDGPRVELARMYSVDKTWKQAQEPMHRIWEDLNSVQLRIHRYMYPEVTEEQIRAEYERRAGTPEQGGGGVGPGLPFADELIRLTGRPIGIVPCALGSTGLGLWTREWAVANSTPEDISGSLFWNLVWRAKQTGAAAGLVWYQGEGDSHPDPSRTYAERFIAFLNDVRKEIGQPDLPALVVQIANVDTTHPKFREIEKPGSREGWERVREQIRIMPTLDPRIRTAVAADLPRWDFGHISAEGHRELGRRLAIAALALAGKAEIPDLQSIERLDDPRRLRVTFSGVQGSLVRFGAMDGAFEIRRPDGTVQRPGLWVISGNVIELMFAEPVGDDDELIHGPGFAPALAAKDERGLPLPCFGPVRVVQAR